MSMPVKLDAGIELNCRSSKSIRVKDESLAVFGHRHRSRQKNQAGNENGQPFAAKNGRRCMLLRSAPDRLSQTITLIV
jgi:hypothetical protein